MKKFAFMALAMFALVFALGCTGGEDESVGEGTVIGPGFDLKVAPTVVVEGGIVTADLRIENIFENDMTNVKVNFKGVSSRFVPSGQITTDGTTLIPGQTYPVIMTLDAAENAGNIEGKSVEVCFDYLTDYFFDVGIKPKADASEELLTASGASDGPIGLSVSGFENVYYETLISPGAVSLTNDWQGEIEEINSINAGFPLSTTGITAGSIGISSCTDTTDKNGDASIKSTDATCGTLSNKVTIANGLPLKATVTTPATGSSVVERVIGTVDYTYCYDIKLPDITIQKI